MFDDASWTLVLVTALPSSLFLIIFFFFFFEHTTLYSTFVIMCTILT